MTNRYINYNEPCYPLSSVVLLLLREQLAELVIKHHDHAPTCPLSHARGAVPHKQHKGTLEEEIRFHNKTSLPLTAAAQGEQH
ncbi:hypothetical protein JOB18_043667 [Solea senegalensis]|uniref:Uncharacterized protein n=1 Tax=Solea senegalensis TaxID=28829 RepID=A0AAV6T1S8_SOLSE|nr:hypothetical protein JOB18_043667 [Solea senegalensis]